MLAGRSYGLLSVNAVNREYARNAMQRLTLDIDIARADDWF